MVLKFSHVTDRTPYFPIPVPRYRVLHDYSPQNEGDLTLTKGDWITLIEAPYGGEWWQGSVGDKEGWFPKSYVEYVDMQAEKKKLEEGRHYLTITSSLHHQ